MTIGEQWESFRKEYVPADAASVQVTETRRAFYAGAAAFFGGIYQSLDDGAETTDEDVAKLAAMHQELLDFGALVESGKA